MISTIAVLVMISTIAVLVMISTIAVLVTISTFGCVLREDGEGGHLVGDAVDQAGPRGRDTGGTGPVHVELERRLCVDNTNTHLNYIIYSIYIHITLYTAYIYISYSIHINDMTYIYITLHRV